MFALCHGYRHMRRSLIAKLTRKAPGGQGLIVTQNHGSFDDIVQFANVAGIAIALQQFLGIGFDVDDFFAELFPEPQHGLHAKGKNVFRAYAQRRKFEGHDVQPEEEVFAEGAASRVFLEITIGRGHQPKIDRQVLRAAQAPEGPLLQHAQ